MPVTYNLIASNTLSSSAASVTFSSIPNTYTDLVIRQTVRSTNSGQYSAPYLIRFNGTTTGYSNTFISANTGTPAVGSGRYTGTSYLYAGWENAASAGANTFSVDEIYIPSYTASQNKPLSIFNRTEDNTTLTYGWVNAGLWSNTAAITSISIFPSGGNWASGSSFFLYGIKNS